MSLALLSVSCPTLPRFLRDFHYPALILYDMPACLHSHCDACFLLSRPLQTRVSVLNAGLLVGGVLTQSYWDKLERGSDTTASPSRAAVSEWL